MSKEKTVDLGLKTAFDELFMSDAGRAENRLPKIYDIPLSEIDDFPDHPFQVRLDDDMDALVQSVKERGNRPCMYRLFFCYSCYQNVVTAQQKNGAYKICFQNIRDKSRRKREIAFFVPHNKSNGVRLIFSKSRCYSCCKNVIKLDGGAK